MSNLENTDYFAKRALEERAFSLAAQDERVSAAHSEMAERYDRLAVELRVGRPPLHIAFSRGDALV